MSDFWFESGDVRLFCVESGEGPPLVLLHGGLAAHQAARQFAGGLDAYRLITPDLRANGRSHYAGALSWDAFADDVAALLAHAKLERATIAGMSFGAGVALRTALRHPQLVERLVLLNPAFGGIPLTPAQVRAMDAMHALGRRVPAEGIEVLLTLLDDLPAPIRTRARALYATFDPASVAAMTAFMASGAQPCRPDELASIRAPTVIVPGIDPEHPREVADALARIPNSVIATQWP